MTRSPASSRRPPGAWCGIAPLGPLATMVSNATPSAPRSTIARSTATAMSRSVRPGRSSPSTSPSAALVISQARRSRSISASSLTMRRSSTTRPSGTSRGAPASAASTACRSTVISWASNASVAAPASAANSIRAGSTMRSVISSRSAQSLRAASA